MADEKEIPMTAFLCDPPKDHVCDDLGPLMCGGTNEDGSSWVAVDSPESRVKARWGSVSCSVCGMTAMERGMWVDW